MEEILVPHHAIGRIQQMIEAAANGGKLQCIEQSGGSKIFYIKQSLRPNEEFLVKLLRGKPGPGPSAPVLRLVPRESANQSAARQHVKSQLPEFQPSSPKQRSIA